MSTYLSRSFWAQAVERAVKSGAQILILTWFGSNSGPVNAFELDWQMGAGAVAGAVILSVVTSVASAPVGADNSPSLV